MPLPVIVPARPLYSRLAEFTPSVPFSGPVAVGRKVTVTVQFAPAATVLPHADIFTEYWPVVTNGGTGSGPEATLVNVNVCAEWFPTSRLPKLKLVGDMLKPGVPVPVSCAVS